MLRADKQAEVLLGVNDEASDKFFLEKETLEKKLKCLEAEHSVVHDEYHKNFASCRVQLMTYPRQAFTQLEDTRVAFIQSVKRSSESQFSDKTEELRQQVITLNRAKSALTEVHDKQKKEDTQKFLEGKLGPEEKKTRETTRGRELQEACLRLQEARLAYSLATKKEQSVPPETALEPSQFLQVPSSLPYCPSAAPEVANVTNLSSLSTPAENMGDETVAYQKAKKELENAQRKHLEAALKKKRKDEHEKPIMTGVTKINLRLVQKLIKDCKEKDTFSSLKKQVDPHLGDIYVYKCGAPDPVAQLDCIPWKLSHSEHRKSKILFGDQTIPQHTYVRTTNDEPQKRIIIQDSQQQVIVVHYR